jgi:probable F420-dependent oxidoreductase
MNTERGTAPRMRFGLALPHFRAGASREGIDATAEAIERLGWDSVWTTDHVLPDQSPRAADYSVLFEALATLAYLAGRTPRLRLGTSVIVVPMRNAVLMAREVASIDALSDGRVTLGVGVGWSEAEFSNVGAADIFHRRGAHLNEAIALWRHLWSGSEEPFKGRFHVFEDYRFAPLPAQGAALPIIVGGGSEAALRRAGELADGWHATTTGPDLFAEKVPLVREFARAASRPEPAFSARIRVRFDPRAASGGPYVLTGTPEEMRADVDGFAKAGATLLVVDLLETDPARSVAAIERFHRDVVGGSGS